MDIYATHEVKIWMWGMMKYRWVCTMNDFFDGESA